MITQQRLKEVLSYNPETGIFTWRVKTGKKVVVGASPTNQDSKGYLRVQIDGKRYPLHRLAWLYLYGYWPTIVDHIDGDKHNNRGINLRQVTQRGNTQNIHTARAHNATGLLGVGVRPDGLFRARITVDGVERHLGVFPSAEEAHQAYLSAKRIYHPTCAI